MSIHQPNWASSSCGWFYPSESWKKSPMGPRFEYRKCRGRLLFKISSDLSQNSPIIWRKTGDKTSSKRSKSYPRLQWRIQGGKGRILKDFFTIEQSVICKNLEKVINDSGILVQENFLVICFPNCVQIWKGRDWKTVFCMVRHKKCRAKGETLMSNLTKSCFPNLSFSNYFSWW